MFLSNHREKSFINILSTGGDFFPSVSIKRVVATGRCSVMKGFLPFLCPQGTVSLSLANQYQKDIIAIMLLEMEKSLTIKTPK